MKYQYLMSDQTLFRDRDVFEIDHIPDQFEYREAQLRELAFSLSPGLHGSRPLNTVLRGLPGPKTTSIVPLFRGKIQPETRSVYINCQRTEPVSVFRKFPALGNIAAPFGKILHASARGILTEHRHLVCLGNYLLPQGPQCTLYSLSVSMKAPQQGRCHYCFE